MGALFLTLLQGYHDVPEVGLEPTLPERIRVLSHGRLGLPNALPIYETPRSTGQGQSFRAEELGDGGQRGVGRPLAAAQAVDNVLGSPVLAFGKPLAYLAHDRLRYPVRFQPANKLFLAYRELDALQVALRVLPRACGEVLSQEVHGFCLASSMRSVAAHPMIQQARLWSNYCRPRRWLSRRRRRKVGLADLKRSDYKPGLV